MADKIVIELDLESGDVRDATRSIEKSLGKSGKKSASIFSKEFDTGLNVSLGNIASTAFKAVTAIGGVASALFGIQSIRAAQVQEDAIERLNRTLQSSGDFSQEASIELQNFAASLQDLTEFGDETLINQLALAKSFGATNDQAKEVVETATGLAKAFGTDLESATRNVAKTLGGYAGELGETIPELKALTTAQLQAGEGIDLISAKFADQGKNLNTFSFFAKQASNTFGDLTEIFGTFITKSPIILELFKGLNQTFKSYIPQVQSLVDNFDLVTDAIVPLSKFADGIIAFVISPLELMSNIFSVAQSGLNTFVASVIAGFGQLAGAAGQLIQFFSPDSETAQALNNFAVTSAQVFRDNANEAVAAYDSILDFPLSEGLATKNEEFRTSLVALNEGIREQSLQTNATLGESLTSQNEVLFQAIDNAIKKQQESLKKAQAQVNQIVNQGIARGISGGIQNIVSSLANGENAFANFGNFVLTTFGDLAIQLGQFFIAQGIAIEALNAVSGTGAIAAGVGLIALGALLKSFSSSGGSSASSGGGVAAVGAEPVGGQLNSGVADPQAQTQAEERTNLSLNIEGSLVRESELNGYISEILEEGSSRNATIIPSLRTS